MNPSSAGDSSPADRKLGEKTGMLGGRYPRSRKPRVLVLARVFPPRIGGIEQTIYNIYSRLAATHDITVVTPMWRGAWTFDRDQPFIVQLLRDSELARTLAEAGRKRAEERFRWDIAAGKVAAIVETLR